MTLDFAFGNGSKRRKIIYRMIFVDIVLECLQFNSRFDLYFFFFCPIENQS